MGIKEIAIMLGSMLIAYLIGSISVAIMISKRIYKKDVRLYGSGNAGGTNVGRVLGKKAGLAVMVLDVLKSVVAFWLVYLLLQWIGFTASPYFEITVYLSSFAAAIGHCYPIYHRFRGGKAVSMYGGYTLATSWLFTILGLSTFFLTLKLKKMVSLASIITASTVALLSWLMMIPGINSFGMWTGIEANILYAISSSIQATFLILRHKENIQRIIAGNERKISWMK